MCNTLYRYVRVETRTKVVIGLFVYALVTIKSTVYILLHKYETGPYTV